MKEIHQHSTLMYSRLLKKCACIFSSSLGPLLTFWLYYSNSPERESDQCCKIFKRIMASVPQLRTRLAKYEEIPEVRSRIIDLVRFHFFLCVTLTNTLCSGEKRTSHRLVMTTRASSTTLCFIWILNSFRLIPQLLKLTGRLHVGSIICRLPLFCVLKNSDLILTSTLKSKST
jgi:hypothetical protein